MPYVSSSTVRTYRVTSGPDGTRTTTTTSRTTDGGHHNQGTRSRAIPHNPRAHDGGHQHGSEKFSTPRGRGSGTNATAKVPGAAIEGDYDTLKQKLRGSGQLWEDPDFPADDRALFLHGQAGSQRMEWKRPSEISSSPQFITGGASRFDVRQGELGDCWLLAAVASLSLNKELFEHVVPSDQTFSRDYFGAIRFRFWRFGKWTEVLVDDRLPTRNGRLVYMHSTEKDEFWSALLEKAYAKLFGSYEALKGGSTSEAMEDFTGGITEMFDMRQNPPDNLFDIMLKALKRCSLMGCSIEADPHRVEAVLPNGLIMGHAYSITDIKQVEVKGMRGKVPLIRIRNPWGNEAEWKGAWGDSSREWQNISQGERQRLGLTFDDDGEFWMSFQDFSTNFQKLEICHLGPDSLDSDTLGGKAKRRWETCVENGGWKKRLNAGGCRNYLQTFWTNPQFRVEVVDPDEDDDENMGTIIVGLMQKDMRKKRKEGVDLHTIGYAVYRLNEEQIAVSAPLDLNYFKFNASVAKAPAFINLREVCGRHKLTPGHYVIVPSTFEPDQAADFLLRIFSERPNKSGELDEDTGMVDVQEPPKEMTEQDAHTERLLKEAFEKIAGEDMEVDAYELRDILNAAFKKGGTTGVLSMGDNSDFNFDGFSIETCRSMVALMDCDQSGKLGFEEFKILWNDLRLWKTVFKKYDADKSGNFNSYELRQALNAVGFKVSNKVFNSLVMRYSSKKGVVNFDDYILCCVRLRTVFETFRAQDKDHHGNAIFDQDQFIQCIIYV